MVFRVSHDYATDFELYNFNDDIKAELENTLVVVNEIIRRSGIKQKPKFYILGGAAFALYGLNNSSTYDIDVANRLCENVRELVSDFISDSASEVVLLGEGYKDRAVQYMKELECIDVYLVSKEDLVLSKLLAGRRKDYKILVNSGILKEDVVSRAAHILHTEYNSAKYDTLLQLLHSVAV